nr:PHD finger protein ALFIN-LIKE 4-like [Tanacetum cinerariifolium]
NSSIFLISKVLKLRINLVVRVRYYLQRLQLIEIGSESKLKYEKMQGNDEEDKLEEEDEDGHGDTLCRTCGENYASDEFWIYCDICERASCVFCMKAQEQDDSRFEDESKDEDLIDRISCNTRGVIGPVYRVFRFIRWSSKVTLGRLLSHARGLGFKPRREGFPSGAKKEWGLSPKANIRVLHTAQLDVT